MAWPTSEPCSCLCGHPRTSQFTRHHSRRSRKLPSSGTSVPSARVLLFLSTIVSASAASASPAPPSFLCPSFASNSVQKPCHSRRTDHPPTNSEPDDHNQPQSNPEAIKRWVPDKYEEGPDGIWRRVESYTLYGATVPSTCDGPDCPPPRSVSSVGLPLKPILGGNGTSLTPPPVDIQLPPGWQPAPKPSHGRTTTILAISLALSLFICVLIISSLFWRKSVIDKRKKITDVESKDESRARREDQTIAELRRLEHEKEAKAMQKLWARATARWRANARYTLRLRRGKRMIRSNHPHQSPISAHDSGSHLIGSQPSVLASDVPSREDERLSSQDQHSTPAEDTQMPRRPSSPPAYQHGNGLPSIVISSPTYSTGPCGLSTPSHRSLSQRHSQPSLCPSTADSQQPSSEHDLFHAVAHVATDDKGLLARLADMASAPPEDNDEVSRPQVSAPEWQEELELESFDTTSPTTPDILSAASPFPPPPSKERLAAAERLEYAFTYDDLENAEPELEPSAPPFEERPSLPRDDPSLFPSAPPTFDDDENHRSSLPTSSAPAWEDSFPSSFPPSLPAAGQDHERTVT